MENEKKVITVEMCKAKMADLAKRLEAVVWVEFSENMEKEAAQEYKRRDLRLAEEIRDFMK